MRLLALLAGGGWIGSRWWMDRPERLIRDGHYKEALAAIDARAERLGPEAPDVLYLRGTLELARAQADMGGRMEVAFQQWSKAVGRGSDAALAALAASGFAADRFFFAGFLPRKGGGRAEALAALGRAGVTAVLYEAGNRTAETLRDLAAALGARSAVVARELTKLHEELLRGPLADLAAELEARDEVRGEVTIVVGPPGPGEVVDAPAPEVEPLEDELRRRLAAGEAPSGLARDVAKARGMKRSDVYDWIRKLREG